MCTNLNSLIFFTDYDFTCAAVEAILPWGRWAVLESADWAVVSEETEKDEDKKVQVETGVYNKKQH